MDYSPSGSSIHGDSSGKNTKVDCHALLQRIFPIQGSNPHLLYLLHWQTASLPLMPLGNLLVHSIVIFIYYKTIITSLVTICHQVYYIIIDYILLTVYFIPKTSLQYYLQQPGHRDNLNVHLQRNG